MNRGGTLLEGRLQGLLYEQQLLGNGRPVVPEQHRWRHSCGRAGPWKDRAGARIGGPGHARHCKKRVIEPGARYRLLGVAGGHDIFTVVREERNVLSYGPDKWLARDRDDTAGALRLIAFVRAHGGIIADRSS